MKSWNRKTNKEIKTPQNVQLFFKELFELYNKHDLSISHEDKHGGFILENNDENNITWMKDAALCIN